MKTIQLIVEEINYLSSVRGRKAALTRTIEGVDRRGQARIRRRGGRLAPGQTIDGVAIVESAMTTIRLRAGERAVTTPLGW